MRIEAVHGYPFSPFTGRRWPEGPDEGQVPTSEMLVLPLTCLPASSPRKRGEERLPQGIRVSCEIH
jgi:hypothetical protein